MTGQHPAIDETDYVSAFMSLPEIVQSSILMVAHAGRDLPPDLAPYHAAAVAAAVPLLPRELRDFSSSCNSVIYAWQIASQPANHRSGYPLPSG